MGGTGVNGLKEWVVPEQIYTPTIDGILEILAGGGSKTLEIQVGGGGV